MSSIEEARASIPFDEGDKVRIKSTGVIGVIQYVYYNGFLLIDCGEKITGGIFNNDGTHRVSDVELVENDLEIV